MLLNGDESAKSKFAFVDLDGLLLAFGAFAACAAGAGEFCTWLVRGWP
jgi:hypothetical protein